MKESFGKACFFPDNCVRWEDESKRLEKAFFFPKEREIVPNMTDAWKTDQQQQTTNSDFALEERDRETERQTERQTETESIRQQQISNIEAVIVLLPIY